MPVCQPATKARRDTGGIKPGHADHHKLSLPAIAVAREIAVDAPSHGLNDISRALPATWTRPWREECRRNGCQRGNHILKRLGIFDLAKGDDMRGELVMPGRDGGDHHRHDLLHGDDACADLACA